ncbi:MAG TPA: NADH-quinone oxidoreductase subunit G, partial [Candidatus Competibacteraceae bacterium]|nr:NADH-quinone oxidoreductase subunit G [Candidatus Competibacteraceae bacterium]
FEYLGSEDVLAEARSACAQVKPDNMTATLDKPLAPLQTMGLQRVADVPIYAVDALVRRARALQSSPLAQPAEVRLHPDVAAELGVVGREQVQVSRNGVAVDLPLVLDESLPKGCAWIPAGLNASVALGPSVGPVVIQ